MRDHYRFKIGHFQCLAIYDGDYVNDAATFFAAAPDETLQERLAQDELDPREISTTWSCLFVETGEKQILIDAGFGPEGNAGGRLREILEREGYPPDAIDMVILTHAHADHIGGCVDEAGKPIFRNAVHYMWEGEWAYWSNEANMSAVPGWLAAAARRALPPLRPLMQTVSEPTELLPGIWFLPAHGHTIGHAVVELLSEGERLLLLSDAVLHPIHIEHPDWTSALDQFPEQTAVTRRRLYERAVKHNSLVLAYHFPPFPSLGYIRPNGASWRWEPLLIS